MQQTLYVDPNAPTTPEIDRERLAWTYCYLFDRHISLRIGKAFWSRGPGLCFTPNDANANFPSLRPIPGVQDDLASVVQALVELTQQMTTAHDVLYPSNDRTISLVRGGVYYRHLDDFTRSINGFEAVWRPHKFNTFPCSEIIWATFHYLRLYIYAFAFQGASLLSTSQGDSADACLSRVNFCSSRPAGGRARHQRTIKVRGSLPSRHDSKSRRQVHLRVHRTSVSCPTPNLEPR
jgi:hypothetical protein